MQLCQVAGRAELCSLLSKRHATCWTLNTDNSGTPDPRSLEALGAKPETQEMLSDYSEARLCSNLLDHPVPGPICPFLGERGTQTGKGRKPKTLKASFCIIERWKTKRRPLFWIDWSNCLENVPNTSWDMAGMAGEHVKWPTPSFFKPPKNT